MKGILHLMKSNEATGTVNVNSMQSQSKNILNNLADKSLKWLGMLGAFILMAVGITTSVSAQTVTTYTSSTTYTVPSGITSLTVDCYGAGGGSGGTISNSSDQAGGGGGGGAFTQKTFTVTSGQVYTITIGAAGTAGANTGSNGGMGGTTTVTGTGGTVTALGGGGGGGAATGGAAGTAGAGAAAGTGDVVFAGGNGTVGVRSGTKEVGGAGGGGAGNAGAGGAGTSGGAGANTVGGAAGAGNPNSTPYIGGAGAGATSNNGSIAGVAGNPPGGGAAGSSSYTTAEAGAIGGGGQVIIIAKAAYTWTGATSTDWNTGTNWSTGTVPVASSIVVIATATNQPVISSATAALCGTMTLNSGTSLTVTGTLNDAGNWTNNGGTVSGTGTVTLSGATTTIGGTATNTFPNLTSTGTSVSMATNTTVNGNFTASAGQFNVGASTTSNTLAITGNYIQSGANVVVSNGANSSVVTVAGSFTNSAGILALELGTTATGAGFTVNGTGGTTISGTGIIIMDYSGANAACTFQTTSFTASGTGGTSADGNSTTTSVDFGNGSSTNYCLFKISGNFSHSSTNVFYTSGIPQTGSFVFNGTGTISSPQTLSYAGTNSDYTSYTINTGTDVQLLTGLTLGPSNSTSPASIFTVNGALDTKTFTITGGGTGQTFTLASGATLLTANTNGVKSGTTGSVSTAITSTFNAGANYIFNGTANQSTNFSTATMNNLTIANTGAAGANMVTVTTAAPTVNGALAVNNGILDEAAFQIIGNATNNFTIASGSTFRTSGSGTANFPTLFTTAHCVFNVASTFEYYGATQTVSPTPTYGNLTITTAGIKTAGGVLNIAGNVLINSGATFAANGSNGINVGGNWTATGTYTKASETVTFNGGSAQTITGATTFNNLTINNSSGGVNSTANIETVSNIVTLTNGILTTAQTNYLLISNTATTAMAGGSTTSFVNGPVAWALPNLTASSNVYKYIVGAGTTYLPFSATSITSSSLPFLYVQAFTGSTGGTGDGTTLATSGSLSTTEYWRSVISQGTVSNMSVSLTRQTPVTPYNVIGQNNTQTGDYTSIGGTPSGNSVNNSTVFSPTTNEYYVLAQLATYTITATQNANGSIAPTGTTTVNAGGSQAYTITPNTGYSIATVLIDGVNNTAAVSSGTYTFTNVTANHTITATYAINTFTITVTQGANGTIAPGTTVVNYGSNQTFTITPSTGYHINTVLVDGVNNSGAVSTGSYTFNNVTTTHTLSASFAINTYTLTYTAGANGTISGTTPQTVNYGGSGTPVTAVPNTGYHFVSWSDGVTTASRTDANVTANISVTASFAINTYTLTYAAGANGTITGTTPQTVNYGGSGTQVTAVPNTGYHFVSWSDGVTTASRTDANVTANISVTATFAINTYTITVTQGSNGTIAPGTTTVNYGANQTFTITPNTGYSIATLTVDGSAVTPASSYTFTNVTASHTITATYTINTYTITASSGANGTVTPAGVSTVNYGSTPTYTITPGTGYHVADVLVDGASVGAVTSYTFTVVTANHTISATFAINTYAITVTQGSNGTIAPGTTTVNYGSNQTFTITPVTGYHIATVLVDGTNNTAAVSSGTYTFSNVTATHTITATYAINTYTITVTQGANGTIAPGTTTVNYGSNQTFTITPVTGYHIATVLVDGTNNTAAVSSGTYTFSNVTATHTITATYAINTYAITVTQGANGTIAPGTTTVNYGSSQTFTITPNAGYSIASLTVDGSAVTPASSYTFTNVTATHTITATYSINTFTITASSDANGSISPNGSTTVNYGSNQTFTITPNSCNIVATLTVDGSSVAPATSYTFSNVTANHTISVTFAAGALSLNSGAKNPNCDSAGNANYNNGSFDLQGVGGTTPYAYAFNSGNTITGAYGSQQYYPNIPANTNYTLSVKDATGCVFIKTKQITRLTGSLSTSATDVNATTAQVCYGKTQAIFVSGHPGTAPYTWSINGGSFGSTRPNYVSSGTYSAVVKDAEGCTATTNSVIITQPSAPLAFTTQIQHGVCGAGRTVTVTATGGYGSYKYLLAAGAPNYSGTPTSGGSSYTFTNVTPGTYTVTVADVNGCSTSNVIHVTDDAAVPKIVVVTNSNTVNAGSTLTYSVSPVAGVTYTWSVPAGDQVVSGQGTATVQINWVTSGPLKLTASASCTTSTSQWEEYVTVTNGGGNPAIAATLLQQSKISVYPNPASDIATVVYTAIKEGKYTLSLSDVTGKTVVRQDAIANKGENFIKLNVGNYANGLYFIRLSDGSNTQTIKLVKAK